MREECGKFGAVANIVIPRPDPSGQAGTTKYCPPRHPTRFLALAHCDKVHPMTWQATSARPYSVVVPGLGKVFVQYVDVAGALAARNALHGRKFGGQIVKADYLSEQDFAARVFI